MKYTLSFALFFLIFNTTSAQTPSFNWVKTFNGTVGIRTTGIAHDGYGNTYTTGEFSNTVDFDPGPGVFNLVPVGYSDVFVLKLDPLGNFLWAVAMVGSSFNTPLDIDVDLKGNAIIVGTFEDTVDFDPGPGIYNLVSFNSSDDAFVVKLNSSGIFQWAAKMGENSSIDDARSVATDSMGAVYTTGTFQNSVDFDPGLGSFILSPESRSFYVQKLDSNGVFQWAKGNTFGTSFTNISSGYSISIDSSNRVLVAGRFQDTVDLDTGPGVNLKVSNGSYDAFVLKLSDNGDYIWSKTFGGNLGEEARGLCVDKLGNVIATGYVSGIVDFDPDTSTYYQPFYGNGDIFLQKLDSNGNFLWAKTVGSQYTDIAQDVITDTMGNIYCSGIYRGSVDFDPGPSAFILTGANPVVNPTGFIQKLDENGNFVWAGTLFGVGEQHCNAVSIDKWNSLYTAGFFSNTSDFDPNPTVFNATAPNYGAYVLKLHQCISSSSTDSIIACDSLTWLDGITYTSSTNTPTWTVLNAVGCDSVITLNLSLNNIGVDTQFACDSFIWIDGNTYYTSNNTSTDTLLNYYGCDSIVTLDLTIMNDNVIDIQSTCDSFTWINGVTYSSSTNLPTWTLTNISGCDSIVTLNLTILNDNVIEVQSACDSFTWIDGVAYSSSTNLPTWTLTNISGCDSIVNLDLTVNYSTAYTDVVTSCDSFTWMDGITYTNSTNIPTWTLTNSVGCDSIVSLDFTINSINSNITQINAITLSSDASSASYQWLDCDNGYTILPGEINQTFVATTNGNYAVQVSVNGCIDTSSCILIDQVSFLENTFGSDLTIYPNPTSGALTIDLGREFSLVTVRIVNALGQNISTRSFNTTKMIDIDIEGKLGVYTIEIQSELMKAKVMVVKQ